MTRELDGSCNESDEMNQMRSDQVELVNGVLLPADDLKKFVSCCQEIAMITLKVERLVPSPVPVLDLKLSKSFAP